MLSIKPLGSAQSALSYYSSKDNYYLKDKGSLKSSSSWMGRGAESLDLVGVVEQEPFLKLLNGELDGGQRLGVMKNGKRQHRVGTDITLSAPKSVSIIALVLGDNAVLEAHEKAVDSVFKRIEAMAAEARITLNKETSFQKTGNLTCASFLHTSSRALDPNLHTHLVILNMTKRLDGLWRALSSREKHDVDNLDNGFREIIYQNQHYFGLIYMSTLAKSIKALGFDIHVKDMHGNFEVQGVPQALIDHLSKRRSAILLDMAQKNTFSTKAAEVSNVATRERKQDTDTQTLVEQWKNEVLGFGISLEDLKNLARNSKVGETTISNIELCTSQNSQEAVSDALEHLSEFNTHIHHATLVKAAFGFAMGTVLHDEVELEIENRLKDGRLLGKKYEYYTTDAMLKREQLLVDRVLKHKISEFNISSSSIGLAARLLKNRSALQIVDVNGFGNQKELLNELVNIAERHKINAYVLHQSKYNTQILSDDIKRDPQGNFFRWLKSFFKDDIAHTVAGFSYKHGKTVNTNNKQSLVVVHDAQKLSLIDIERLKMRIDPNKGKLILLNNSASTHGYSTGNPIKTLKENNIKVTKSFGGRRLAKVNIVSSVTPMDDMAKWYATECLSDRRATLLVLTKTHKNEANHKIRQALKGEGVISQQEKAALVLSTQGLTDTEKKHLKYYSLGDRLTFKAFTSEQKHYSIVGKKNNTLILRNSKGELSDYKLEYARDYQVSRVKMLALSEKELITNDREISIERRRYAKGSLFQVMKISQDGIEIQDQKERVLTLNNKALSTCCLSHAYVKKPVALDKNDIKVALYAKPYQINRNTLGEISDKARHITLFTSSVIKAQSFFDKEQVKWTAKDVCNNAPSLVYRHLSQSSQVIEKDIKTLVDSLDIDKDRLDKTEVAKLAVAYGVAKCAERNAAFKHSDLIANCLKYALGKIDYEDIVPALKERLKEGSLKHSNTFWYTKESLDMEQEILKNNVTQQGVLTPIIQNNERLLALPERLTRGQKDAITLVCISCDRFNTIQGLAGVGKTTMMQEIQKIVQENGYKVIGLAPTHPAKNELIKNTIVSETVASALLSDIALDEKTIVIADEASMLDNSSYLALQKKVINSNARLVYTGDITQLQSLSSGIPHELTVKSATQKTAYMNEMIRQNPNPALKKAAMHSSRRDIREAFSVLDTIDPRSWVERTIQEDQYRSSVVEVISEKDTQGNKSHHSLYQAIADDYLSRIKECRDNTAVIVPVHKDRAFVNALIRQGLQDIGEISNNNKDCLRLVEKTLDTADLTDINSYKSGDVIRFGRTYHVGKKGDYYKIESLDPVKNIVRVTSPNVSTFKISTKMLVNAKVSLYKEEPTHLAVGDRIRSRLTDENIGTIANTEYQVVALDKDIATIENKNGRVTLDIGKQSGQHWDHAYTNTAYSIQGMTEKYAIALELVDNTVAMNHRAHGIINTRPSCHLTVYTNDREGLLKRISDPLKQRDTDKTSAIIEYKKAKSSKERQDKITADLNHIGQSYQHKKVDNKRYNGALAAGDSSDNSIDAKVLFSHLVSQSEALVCHLLGEPNHKCSKKHNYRYGAKGSLSIDLNHGVWNNFETGEKGNLYHLIAIEKGLNNFQDTLKYAADFCNYNVDRTQMKPSNRSSKKHKSESNPMYKWAIKYYNQSESVSGSIVENYLQIHRGIHTSICADIRFCPGVYTKTERGIEYPPAMLAFSRNNQGEVNHIQITRLSSKNAQKAHEYEIVKQTFGKNNGYTVNLNHQGMGDTTFYTEGVETGLSIVESLPNSRVYTVLGIENFCSINIESVPSKTIVLCVDNDGLNTFKTDNEGKNIVTKSVMRLEEKGFDVWISLPKKEHQDLNDILREQGTNALKKELKSIIRLDDFMHMCDKQNVQSTSIESHSSSLTPLKMISKKSRVLLKISPSDATGNTSATFENVKIQPQNIASKAPVKSRELEIEM